MINVYENLLVPVFMFAISNVISICIVVLIHHPIYPFSAAFVILYMKVDSSIIIGYTKNKHDWLAWITCHKPAIQGYAQC